MSERSSGTGHDTARDHVCGPDCQCGCAAGLTIDVPRVTELCNLEMVAIAARAVLAGEEDAQPPEEMTPEEIRRADEIGPPDFLLGDDFDAENGAGASDELRRIAEENTRG